MNESRNETIHTFRMEKRKAVRKADELGCYSLVIENLGNGEMLLIDFMKQTAVKSHDRELIRYEADLMPHWIKLKGYSEVLDSGETKRYKKTSIGWKQVVYRILKDSSYLSISSNDDFNKSINWSYASTIGFASVLTTQETAERAAALCGGEIEKGLH